MLQAIRRSSLYAGFRRWRTDARQRWHESTAIAARARTNAKVIAITGSSAKSTTTALLSHILSRDSRITAQVGTNGVTSSLKALGKIGNDSAFVVLEIGTGGPGQIAHAANVARPDIGLVTMVAMEHKSAFGSLDAIAREKGDLVQAIQPGGLAVLNADDPHVIAMRLRTAARIVTFGRREKADYQVRQLEARVPGGLSLAISWRDQTLELQTRFLGEQFWLPTLAAVATAIELGIPPATIAGRVSGFEPVFGRCNAIAVSDGPFFILDTTKAPWHSLELAFDLVAGAEAPRKRIVLGHMSDFAGSDTKYRDAYRMARSVADEVVFVGDHAHRSKASLEDRQQGRFVAFATPLEAYQHIRRTAIAGEVILLKGSVDLHLERIALAFQGTVECWVPACGRMSNCNVCGCWGAPYPSHKGKKASRPALVAR